jgi:pimeloyl-ACP methyl ester carboxylesterase
MKNRIDNLGGDGPPLFLAHANGYPPACYRQLTAGLTPHHQLIGLKHRALRSKPHPPAKIRWDSYAQDMIDSIRHYSDEPAWVMGHSLGATTAILAALQQPELFKGLILLDPVLLPTRIILGLKLLPDKARKRLRIVRKTLGRPDRWPTPADAFSFHRNKPAFKGLQDDALWDYINGATRRMDDSTQLAFSKYWEAHIYSTPPWMWGSLHKLKLPVLCIRGQYSDVFTQRYWQRWQRAQTKAENIEIANCGHLFPLEKPQETAHIILRFLARESD